MTTVASRVVKRKPSVVKKKSLTVVKNKQKVSTKQQSNILEHLKVKRKLDAYWKERGWKESFWKNLFSSEKIYVGYYRTKHVSFKGEVVGNTYYIHDLTKQILKGPHKACFFPVENTHNLRIYKIHFAPHPDDINSGIASVERTIIESYTK